MHTPIRILVVDNERIYREGIRDVLKQEPDMTIVGEAADLETAFVQLETMGPQVALIDLSLKRRRRRERTMPQPDLEGLEIIRHLSQSRSPTVGILVITHHDDPETILAAVRTGADGYLIKDDMEDGELAQAIRVVARGRAYFHPAVKFFLEKHLDGQPALPPEKLTRKELAVLELVALGLTNEEIANDLRISAPTVRDHVSNILGKLSVKSRTGAAVYAVTTRLVKLRRSFS